MPRRKPLLSSRSLPVAPAWDGDQCRRACQEVLHTPFSPVRSRSLLVGLHQGKLQGPTRRFSDLRIVVGC
jgi:hypothetical protein